MMPLRTRCPRSTCLEQRILTTLKQAMDGGRLDVADHLLRALAAHAEHLRRTFGSRRGLDAHHHRG
jgi:hypothetical protein